MVDESVAPLPTQSGNWRIAVKTRHSHCWTRIGVFPTSRSALRLATDLVDTGDGLVTSVRIEYRDGRRRWKPAWWA